ncbi:hypothetical protein SERLADRAFT_461108 [Serpula lacrymans var. lacrymans S7.9]|nr:uncharacterized protein SERLADRAFT_461108 [Serpula lacrymans var. lacrymans S7.9]EGO27517.1 hypothetical protein SERLADRAFT_461108 [Serpula lacrymans var. lacrymans S7.9]
MIVLEATRLARGAREAWDTDPINTAAEPGIEPVWDELFRSRVAYQTQMVEALQFTVYPPAPLMPQPAVFLDYIPWVRYIVEVDDILERQAWDGIEKQRSGRLTRNSMKTKHAHARTIELSEEEQRILATTKLEGL